MTRVQQERFSDPEEYERLRTHFILRKKDLKACKEKMAIMHPLPRVGEIDPACDNDPRAAYFRQVYPPPPVLVHARHCAAWRHTHVLPHVAGCALTP